MWAASGSEAIQKALWAALARDRLGVAAVVFFVMSAAAPLTERHAAIGEGHVSARSVAQRLARELRGGDHEEQLELIKRTVKLAAGKATVLAGTGASGKR